MQHIVNGETVEMTPEEVAEWLASQAEVAPVPVTVTPLQARKALRQAGFKAAVDAYVSSLDEEAQEEWEYAVEVRRDHPVIVNGGASLGLTVEQLDDLFRLASTL